MFELRACLLSALILALLPQPALAQLAPTGQHYAGRSSDTGYGGTFANETGTFSTSVPLDLPKARGGLPIPLEIAYTAKGVGAAGSGWDVPLSFLRHHSTFAYRRPVSAPGAPPSPRERTTISLLGRQMDLVSNGDTWVARSGTLELVVRQNGDTWLAYDGSGRTYSFDQPPSLSGTGLWLLSSISGAGGSSLTLTYAIQNAVPINNGAAWGLSIDLTQIDYNFLPPIGPLEPPGCPKNEITLSYQPHTLTTKGPLAAPPSAPALLSMSILGNTVVVRQTRLTGVDVKSRIQCRDPFQSLRTYILQYGADADTKLPRLQGVRMSGRQGTAEANTTVPIGNYQYGSATDGGALNYALTMTVPIPGVVGSDARISDTKADASVTNPGSSSDVGYAMWQSLTDVTGDGRPDLIFKKNNQLWVAYNQFAANGSTTIVTQTSTYTRYKYTGNRNTTDIWREAIDVNGDGRIDIVDAAEEPNHWVVYLNTPGPNGGVTWVRRSFSVLELENYLNAFGHHLDGPYLPLSRRSTGTSLWEATCWRWDGAQWLWYPAGFANQAACPGQPNHPTNRGPEQTFVEWDLIDVNGDGYPDFVFDSSPVDWYASPPSQHGAPNTDTGIVGEWVEFGPQQQNNQWAVNGRQPCNKAPQDCANANDIKVAYNVAGIRFDVDQNVFSNYVSLSAPGTNMGVAQWSCTGPCQYFYGGQPYTPQYQFSGFADVNGDGLVDRIVGNTAYLGTGAAFSNAFITLPGPMALTINDEPQVCKSGQQGKPTSHQLNGLRDLSGDGLPDYYDALAPTVDGPSAPAVWIGTGTGFVGPVPIKSSQIGFRWSDQTETCDGSASSTDGGLFDIDGDGRPDVLTIGSTKNGTENGTVFWVSQLVGVDGQDPGRPEAGRLTRFDNGYGAVTQLSYTSAKQHTDNALAFPENVVTGVTVTGADHLGGTLAGSRFAYGNGSLVFDSALDRFVFPGYGRSAELQLFDAVQPIIGSGRAVGLALVTDRFGLTPFDPALSQHDRWVREKRVGQVSQTLTIHDITTTDPWGLLDTPALAQFVTSATEVARDANYYEAPAPANWNALDCFDMFLPYDYALSLSYNGTLSGGIDACRAHGFAYPTVITTWRGDSSPPSDQNVQTATRVLSIDDYGQPLELQLSNDVFRSDDDLCVDNVYATSPSGTLPRVVHALASRRIGTVCGSSVKNVPLAYDTWNYDNLPSGAVSTGLVTSHSLERHATDSGELLGTVRVFDATYDGLGNISTVTTTHGAASRTTTFTFDPFGLVPTQTRIDATGVPSRLVTTTYDPLSLQAASSTDINGTVRGLDFDGFDRPVRSTLTPAGGSLGVISTTSYLGFDGADPAGRRLSGTGFTDPVDPAQISTAVGQTAVTYLDELGRERRTEVSLGGDYADQTLVVGARTYDGVGRVSFEADAYPKSVNLLSAYGTSYFYTQNDDLNCLIRGTGPQELTDISDLATERFPTCLIHRFASNTEIFEVRDASSLLANSPQAGVVQRTVQTAIGRTIERSTVSSAGVRLEAATYSYDHLGQPTSILRYLDPSNVTFPTPWTRRLDSLGQLIQYDEPTAPSRFFEYSDWGEPTEIRWQSGAITHQLLRNFDSLSRITESAEQNNGVTDPTTVITYAYDSGINASPLVTPTFVLGHPAGATWPNGRVAFSYDPLGQTNGEVFTDQAGALYVQKPTHHANGLLNSLEFDLPDRGYNPETASYGYDSANRLRSINYLDSSGSVALSSADAIDALGRVQSAHYGPNVTYHGDYANTGRELITDAGVSSSLGSRLITFGPFDPLNRETSRQQFVNGAAAGTETDSAYDALGQLASVRVTDGGSTLFDWNISYDAQGNISQILDEGDKGAAVLLGVCVRRP